MMSLAEVTHLNVAKEGAPGFVKWLGEVGAGLPVASDC